jgi:hypothetical protein
MDNLDNKPSVQPDPSDLQARYDELRHLVVSLLILVVVISGTLNIYLLRQWRSTSKDLAAIGPQARQMIADFQRNSGPLMQDFVRKITEYGRTHADFAPILAKYGLKPATPTNPPPAIPAAPSPKK